MNAKRVSKDWGFGFIISAMKALEKALKGYRCLVFLDLEGTQYTHEMIEIGAYKVLIRDDLTVKKVFKGYESYVKAHARIGYVVTKLTGITDQKIKTEGIPFRLVQQQMKKYLGAYWKKCLFVTFGSHDLCIVNETTQNNLDCSVEETRYMNHHTLDFSAFLATYVKDDNNNPLSLANYLKVFEVPFEGKAHDALVDAYNLLDLYKAVLSRKDILEQEYRKTLARIHHLPQPICKVLQKLDSGETVDPEFYTEAIRDSLK